MHLVRITVDEFFDVQRYAPGDDEGGVLLSFKDVAGKKHYSVIFPPGFETRRGIDITVVLDGPDDWSVVHGVAVHDSKTVLVTHSVVAGWTSMASGLLLGLSIIVTSEQYGRLTYGVLIGLFAFMVWYGGRMLGSARRVRRLLEKTL
ncbi:MAG: hypothetical protein REI94_14865 [Moraxellaceae bacterium]|nr:hypothetical protein [Moraxellaceae bacterium]